MPYLMLHFEAQREMTEIDKGGKRKHVPTGREQIKLTMMNTDSGEIAEFDIDAAKVKQSTRPPSFGETHTASQTLGKGTGEGIDRVAFDRTVAERNSYREKSVSAEQVVREKDATIKSQKKSIELLGKQIETMKARDWSAEEREILGASLATYIEFLLDTQQYEKYEQSKKFYKRLTGKPWVDDGLEDDDDEEADRQPDPKSLNDFIQKIVDEQFGKGFFTVDWTDYQQKSDPIEDLRKWQRQIFELERQPPSEMIFFGGRRGGFTQQMFWDRYSELLYGRRRQPPPMKYDYLLEPPPPPTQLEALIQKKQQNAQNLAQFGQKKRAPKKLSPRKSR